MKIGPLYPEKGSPEMAGSQKKLETLNDDPASTRAEIGRLADMARKTDRVELGNTRDSNRAHDIYSRRSIEEPSVETDFIEPGRLSERRRQEILDKIERGFYSSDDVKSRIIDKLLGGEDDNSIKE